MDGSMIKTWQARQTKYRNDISTYIVRTFNRKACLLRVASVSNKFDENSFVINANSCVFVYLLHNVVRCEN